MANGHVNSWTLHRSFILLQEHEICSYLKFCEVEENSFVLKVYPLSNTVCGGEILRNLRHLSVITAWVVVERERQGEGDGACCTQIDQHHDSYEAPK